MGYLKSQIENSFKEGSALHFIYEVSLGDEDKRNILSKELAEIHNEGVIDVISIFKRLKNQPNLDYNFFLTRHVFERILPELNSSVLPVMECVIHLVKEAGQDLAAGALFDPFIKFCELKEDRPKKALKIIEQDKLLADLFTPVIIAGARSDIKYFFDETIRLAGHTDIELRRRAILSLGSIKYSNNFDLIIRAVECLKKSADNENDDILLGNLIKAAFNLVAQSKIKENNLTGLIKDALSKGDEYAIHAASELWFFNHDELPDDLLQILLNSFVRINPKNNKTLKNIDYGLAKFFKRAKTNEGILFLEAILLRHSNELEPKVFSSTMRELYKNENQILNKLLTKWLSKGDSPLCLFIREVVNLQIEKDIVLAVDKSSLNPNDLIEHVFLARKAVGYLFFKPVTTASIIISIIQTISDDETLKQLCMLLFDPLLINYPGKIMKLLKLKVEEDQHENRKYIEDAILFYDDYLSGLKSTGPIVELHPSQTQRDEYMRYFSRIMSESMKEAEKNSIWQTLCSKSVLLYGNKSINYIYDSNSKPKRMEIPLQHHETQMEFPRLENIDPFGLDYMLRIFRVEQRTK